MLPSSFEYFNALRAGDFLLFLEWPAFIQQKYTDKSEALGADSLIDCMVFEWLAQGFLKEQVEKIAILYAVYDLEPSPLQVGKYAFPLMSITTAVFSCMVFCRHHLEVIPFPKTKLSAIEVIKFIEDRVKKIDKIVYEENMGIVRDQFMQQMSLVDKAIALSVCKKINLVIEPISILEQYTLTLNLLKDQEKDSSLYGARLGIAQRLLAYMRDQTELSVEVSQQIALYVTAIKRQEPAIWEEVYLNKLAPPTLVEQSWSLLAYTGMRLFGLIVSGGSAESTPAPSRLDGISSSRGTKTEL